jgi:homoserine O-acetyltransferase
MLSYKSDALLRERHDRRADRNGRFRFDVEGYLEHQAGVFEARMDPYSYVALTHAMDSFDVRARAKVSNDRARPTLQFIGISSDWLFTPQDVRTAAERFANAGYNSRYDEIVSSHGHDAFLAEPEKLAALLSTLRS